MSNDIIEMKDFLKGKKVHFEVVSWSEQPAATMNAILNTVDPFIPQAGILTLI